MHLASEVAQDSSQEGREPKAPSGASPSRESEAREGQAPETTPPVIESPPTSPHTSPWWTAPGGKPVDIPAFGRTLLKALIAMLIPAPQPVPIRIHPRR